MGINWRQKLHLEPQVGWLNDPNGLSWFNGKYHVYFQYCSDSPDGTCGKEWGHFESSDFLRWQFTGKVLFQDCDWDRNGVYSGCGVAEEDVLHLFYTGNVLHPGEYDYITAGREANVIHVHTQDGHNMGVKQLVLKNSDYPNCTCHVRDPKIFRIDNGQWCMALGARNLENEGCALLYISDNLENWQYSATLKSDIPMGFMWECPEIFDLIRDGKTTRLLSVCLQGASCYIRESHNIFLSGYFKLQQNFDKTSVSDFHEWDMGFDFYAPQSFEGPDGRRFMIAWMGMPDPDYSNPTLEFGWQHCLTLPCEISVDDKGRVCRNPVRELNKLRQNETIIQENKKAMIQLPFELSAYPTDDFSLIIEESLELTYDSKSGVVELCFKDPLLGAGRSSRKANMDVCQSLLVIVDASSVEIFLENGLCVFSTRFYPSTEHVSVCLSGVSGNVFHLQSMDIAYKA